MLSNGDYDTAATMDNLVKTYFGCGQIVEILKSQKCSLQVKLSLYKAIMHSALLYGLEYWVLNQDF